MMAAQRRRNLLDARRRPDEVEDDESILLDQGDESQSEGSVLTANDDAGDDSDLSHSVNPRPDGAGGLHDNKSFHSRPSRKKRSKPNKKDKTTSDRTAQAAPAVPFKATPLTDAMANGLQIPDTSDPEASVSFENMADRPLDKDSADQTATGNARRQAGPRQLLAKEQDAKRERTSQGYPNIGRSSFSLQHPRSEPSRGNGSGRGRGRGRGTVPTGPLQSSESTAPTQPLPEANGGRWDHDLHDTVANINYTEPGPSTAAHTSSGAQPPTRPSHASSTLSKSVNVGTVTARVYLPYMKTPINFERMPVKQHTRLPDLRPPLRRDKPVRVSIPEQSPRYIFPSVERSFIFIPRAQRPNQQQGGRFRRGGGYFSASGSRRPSIYGGSNYSPSVAMSRRSSIAARDTMISPTGSVRPVVKLPFGAQPFQPVSGFMGGPHPFNHAPAYALPSQPTFRGGHNAIPMHQPRPQKAISVTTIEAPQMDAFTAPHQQEQSPFHHQVPQHMNGPAGMHGRQVSMHSQGSGNTPLSNIPEQAINAQPFQPMYAAAAAGSATVAPSAGAYGYPGMYMYSMPEMQAASGGYMVPVVAGGAGVQGGTMYEQGGTTFYYADPNTQLAMEAQYGASGAPAEGYYYAQPPMMYYPAA